MLEDFAYSVVKGELFAGSLNLFFVVSSLFVPVMPNGMLRIPLLRVNFLLVP
jgi:hypothetical protein